MFCLRHQIRSQIFWICSFICHNQNFTWTCNHVNVYGSVQMFFCSGNKNISRANNFIYLWHGFGTICQSRNCLPIANIPVGTVIHNVEMHPGKGAQLVRSAGAYAQLMAKEGENAQIRMPSGEVRIIRTNCTACIGQVGNLEHENVQIGKAGRKRHMGWRPTVRGSVMNPCDHPHGGGEGKAPVGRPGPVTPWGKPALGYKTRKTKNPTDKFIVKRRNVK